MSSAHAPKRGKPISKAEQKAATRARLLRVAQRTFIRYGFDETTVAMVCRDARVTHGALYHHFQNKTELFCAVLEQVTVDVAAKVREATEKTSGWSQVEAACDAYLDACSDRGVQAILIRDGPRVVPDAFGAIDRATNEPLVTGLMASWVDAGILRPLSIGLVARVLGGAFAEAGAALAAAEQPERVRSELRELFRIWLSALRAK